MEYALQLLIPIVLGLLAGQWADGYFHTTPWFLLLGSILGMVGGIAILYKRSLMTTARKTDSRSSGPRDRSDPPEKSP